MIISPHLLSCLSHTLTLLKSREWQDPTRHSTCPCALCVFILSHRWMGHRCSSQLLTSDRLELNPAISPSLNSLVLKCLLYYAVQLHVTAVFMILDQASRHHRSSMLEAKTRRVSKGGRSSLGQHQLSKETLRTQAFLEA